MPPGHRLTTCYYSDPKPQVEKMSTSTSNMSQIAISSAKRAELSAMKDREKELTDSLYPEFKGENHGFPEVWNPSPKGNPNGKTAIFGIRFDIMTKTGARAKNPWKKVKTVFVFNIWQFTPRRLTELSMLLKADDRELLLGAIDVMEANYEKYWAYMVKFMQDNDIDIPEGLSLDTERKPDARVSSETESKLAAQLAMVQVHLAEMTEQNAALKAQLEASGVTTDEAMAPEGKRSGRRVRKAEHEKPADSSSSINVPN